MSGMAEKFPEIFVAPEQGTLVPCSFAGFLLEDWM
jgi:hypothetical protein